MLRRLAERTGGLLILLLGIVAAVTTPTAPAPAPPGPLYERADINVRGVMAAAAGLIVLLVVSVAATTWIVTAWTGAWPDLTPPATGVAVGPNPAVRGPSGPVPATEAAVPRLQPAPETDISILRAREQAALSAWQWVDREAGIVQIPIDVALRLVADGGLPEFGPVGAEHAHGNGGHRHGPVDGQGNDPASRTPEGRR